MMDLKKIQINLKECSVQFNEQVNSFFTNVKIKLYIITESRYFICKI